MNLTSKLKRAPRATLFLLFEATFILAVSLDLLTTAICLFTPSYFTFEIINGLETPVHHMIIKLHPAATLLSTLTCYTALNVVLSWFKPKFLWQAPRLFVLAVAVFPAVNNLYQLLTFH